MAISNNTPRNQYNANGVQTVFSYGFEIFEQADIKVYVGSTLLTLTTDYTVSGAGNPSGGNVTFLVAPANAEIVTFVRRVPRERTTDYQPNSKLDTDVINADFDRIWSVIQETVDEETRVIRQAVEDGSASMVLPVEADRASKLLGFDLNGNVVVYEAGYTPASELGGHGLSMIRVNAGEDAYEFRTPTQVYTDIGANDASNLSTGTLSDARLSSNVVSLTGSQTLTNKTISGATITGTTTLPGSGQISSNGNIVVGSGSGQRAITINGAATSNNGAVVILQKNSVTTAGFGHDSAIFGGAGDQATIFGSNGIIFRGGSYTNYGEMSSSGGWTFGGTITQSTTASGEFVNFASTAAATESAVRINTTSGTSGIGIKLSNSNLNIQSSMRLGSGGQFDFYTGQTAGGSTVSGSVALRIAHASSANDFVTISNSQNNGGHINVASSANSNARLYLSSLGTESVQFYTNNMATRQFVVEHLGSATEYFAVGGGTSGSPFPYLAARGASSNVNLTIASKGSGSQFFDTGGGSQFSITHTASAVNRISVTGAATTAKPQLQFTGSDTNVDGVYNTKGAGGHYLTTGGGSLLLQLRVDHVINAVNFWGIGGQATGASPQLYVGGSDANIGLYIDTKGAGAHTFRSNVSGGAPTQFQIAHTASAVNFWQVTGNQSTLQPFLTCQGSDTNITGAFSSKGTGSLQFYTNNLTAQQFQITHTASAVNYITVTGAATGSAPFFNFTGSDTDVNGTFVTKGQGGFNFNTNSGVAQFQIRHTGSAVNYAIVRGGATGNRVVFGALGSDTNIGVSIENKGTAVLAMSGQTVGTTVGAAGGATALPATPTGYITININGTDRKIPYYAT